MSNESAKTLTGAVTPSIPATSQTPTNEAGAAPIAPASLQSTPFTHLAKKEAEIVRQRHELKKLQDENRAEKESLSSVKKQFDEYQATKAKDPIAALKTLGFSETDIFNYMSANQPEELSIDQKAAKAAEAAADAKIAAFEAGQLAKQQEEQQRIDQGLIKDYRAEVSKVIVNNPEKFEYCAYHGSAAEQLIYETVLEIVKESKGADVITPDEAAQLVESYYEEQDKLMSGIKKRTPMPQPVVPQGTKDVRESKVTPGFPNEPQPKPTLNRSRTLHQGAKATVAATRQLTHQTFQQKRERLIAAIKAGKI